MVVSLLLVLFLLLVAADGQDVRFERDLDIILVDARQLDIDEVLVVVFRNVNGRRPHAQSKGTVILGSAFEEMIEQSIVFALHRPEVR